MEGTPIFLGATGVETLAEAAMATARFKAAHSCKEDCKATKSAEAEAASSDTASESCICAAKSDLKVTEIKNFSIPYGIKLLQNRPKDIIVSATLKDDGSHR